VAKTVDKHESKYIHISKKFVFMTFLVLLGLYFSAATWYNIRIALENDYFFPAWSLIPQLAINWLLPFVIIIILNKLGSEWED